MVDKNNILDDYKAPSDEEINKHKDFDQFLSNYKTRNSGFNTIRFRIFGGLGIALLISVIVLFSLSKSNEGNNTPKVVKKADIVPVQPIPAASQTGMVKNTDTIKITPDEPIPSKVENIKENRKTSISIPKVVLPEKAEIKEVVPVSNPTPTTEKVKADTVLPKKGKEVIIKDNNKVFYKRNMEELQQEMLERHGR